MFHATTSTSFSTDFQASTSSSLPDLLNQIGTLNLDPDQVESLDTDELKEFMYAYLEEHKEYIRNEKKRVNECSNSFYNLPFLEIY